jgi:hypothetical protein
MTNEELSHLSFFPSFLHWFGFCRCLEKENLKEFDLFDGGS